MVPDVSQMSLREKGKVSFGGDMTPERGENTRTFVEGMNLLEKNTDAARGYKQNNAVGIATRIKVNRRADFMLSG